MNSQHGSNNEPALSSPKEDIRTLCVSAAVSAACFALYFAEDHGFRLFEESVRGGASAEMTVPSPLEVLTVLGVTSVGVCAALIAAISFGGLVVRLVRQLRISLREEAAAIADDRVHHGAA